MFVNCPCCDYPTITKLGDNQICYLCWWEDDGHDIDPNEVGGGPNKDYSLNEARANFKQYHLMYRPSDYAFCIFRNPRIVKLKKEIISLLDAKENPESKRMVTLIHILKKETDAYALNISQLEYPSEIVLPRSLLLSLQSALIGNVPSSLRGITIGWRERTLTIRFIYMGNIPEDDLESLRDAVSEVIADFPKDYVIKDEYLRIDEPTPIFTLLLNLWAFRRKEKSS